MAHAMHVDRASEFVAECLWPGVRDSDLRALDERAASCAARVKSVRYLGSLLMPEDEVVLCLFRGGREAIRAVATDAEIPFDRLLEASRSGWPDAERQ